VRIAYDHQIFSAQRYGGISRYFCEIASRIANMPGVDLAVCAPFWQNHYLTNVPPGIVHGLHLPQFHGRKIFARVASALAGGLALRRFRPDIIHETYFFPFRQGPGNAIRVLTIYDMIHEKFPRDFSALDWTPRYKARAADRANHIICISESTRRDAVELLKVPYEKTSVIYLGHDLQLSGGFHEKETESRLDTPYLLYIGNRIGYKNFVRLLEAYAASSILRRDFKLVCFGGGVLRQDEQDRIRSLGIPGDRVLHFSGDDRVLASLYQHAKVFVYPSLYEGFGIPPLEAMTFDCPVVCSNTSSIPEVVDEAAEYFDPYDVESIRLAIERVVSSGERRGELISKGRKRVSCFSWDRCAAQTFDVYKRLS
jgi:glycosyltransferase involved in cell wall biosynthesis